MTPEKIKQVLDSLRGFKVFNRYGDVDAEIVYWLCEDAAEAIEYLLKLDNFQTDQLLPPN